MSRPPFYGVAAQLALTFLRLPKILAGIPFCGTKNSPFVTFYGVKKF